MKEIRFWRIDPAADYGALNGLARHRINANLITNNWDDILRVAGSLKVGTVHASTLVQALQRAGHPTTLARAIAELGRVAKTLYSGIRGTCRTLWMSDVRKGMKFDQRMWNA
jgi:TnpA family transposase